MVFGNPLEIQLAKQVEITSLPQLVAAFHSLVGWGLGIALA